MLLNKTLQMIRQLLRGHRYRAAAHTSKQCASGSFPLSFLGHRDKPSRAAAVSGGGSAARSQGSQPRGVHCHPSWVPSWPGTCAVVAGVELLQQGWWAGPLHHSCRLHRQCTAVSHPVRCIQCEAGPHSIIVLLVDRGSCMYCSVLEELTGVFGLLPPNRQRHLRSLTLPRHTRLAPSVGKPRVGGSTVTPCSSAGLCCCRCRAEALPAGRASYTSAGMSSSRS